MENSECETWAKLAAELGTTTRSLETWRLKFPDSPKERDAAKWKAFMQERGLGCYSMRRNAPMLPADALPPRPPAPGSSAAGVAVFCCIGWEARASILFEIMEFFHSCRADGQLSAAEYAEIGLETFAHLRALAELWKIPLSDLDPDAWFRTVLSIIIATDPRQAEG